MLSLLLGLLGAAVVLGTPIAVVYLLVQVSRLRREVDALAAGRAAAPPAAGSAVAPPAAVPPPITREAAADVGVSAAPVAATPAVTPPAAAPAAGAPVAPPARGAGLDVSGGRLLALAGGVFVLVGFLFLLTMAITSGWLGPAQQVALGFVAGSLMFAGGVEVVRRGDHAAAGQVLTATGAGVAMASDVAGTQGYGLLGPALGLVIMLVAAAATVVAADRWRSPRLAGLGIVVGLASPALVDAPTDLVTIALAGLALVGAMVLVARRDWPWLAVASTLVTAPQLAQWAFETSGSIGPMVGQFDSTGRVISFEDLGLVAGVLAAWWLVLTAGTLGATLLHDRSRLRAASATCFLTVAANLCWIVSMIFSDGVREHELLGAWWLLAIGVAYAAVGAAVLGGQRRGWAPAIGVALIVTGAAVLALAAAVRFDGPGRTAVWVAEGVLLLAVRCRWRDLRAGAAGGVLAAMVVLFAVGHEAPPVVLAYGLASPAEALLSLALATLGFTAAALVARSFERGSARPAVAAGDGDTVIGDSTLVQLLALLAAAGAWYLASVAIVSALSVGLAPGEVLQPFVTHPVSQDAQLVLSTFWGACGLALLVLGLARSRVRVHQLGFVLLCVAAAKVALFDTSQLDQAYRVVSFVGLGAFLLLGGYVYGRLIDEQRGPGADGAG